MARYWKGIDYHKQLRWIKKYGEILEGHKWTSCQCATCKKKREWAQAWESADDMAQYLKRHRRGPKK